MESTNYHRVLRVASVVFAIALVFESGLISESTATISRGTHSYLANAVGASASVEPTELNKYTAQLTSRDRELDAREAALNEREIDIGLTSGSGGNETATYVLSSILFVLQLLILLNYVLDYLRIKEERMLQGV